MSEAVVDRILLAIGLDTKEIDKGMAQAQNKLVTGFKGLTSKIFAPLLAGLSLSFGAIFDSLNTELKQMNSLSKATHTNIEDMTAWARAVNMSGGNIEAFQGTLMGLNQNLTRIAVTGHSRIKPFFEALGLDAVELAKKPVLDSLSAIGKAIDGMDKRQSANMLRSMGFDNGTIKLLQSGEKGMRELIARQKELGVYTAKDAKALASFNRNIKEITSAIKTLFIPVFTRIISLSSKVVKYITNAIMYLRRNLNVLRGALLALAIVFRKSLIPAVIDLGRAFLTNPFGMFIAGLTLLLLLLEDLWVYAKGGKTAFGNIWKSLGTPDEVMEGFKAAGRVISGFFKFLGNLFGGKEATKETKFILMIVGAIGLLVAAIGWIPVAIATVTALLIRYWEDIKKWFDDLGKRIDEYFGGEFQKNMSDAWKFFGKLPERAFNFVKEKWDEFCNYIKEKWEEIKSIFSFDIKFPDFKIPDFKLPSFDFKIPDFSNLFSIPDITLPSFDGFDIPVDSIKAKMSDISSYIAEKWADIQNSTSGILDDATNDFTAFKDYVSNTWDSITGSVGSVAGSIKEGFSDAFDGVADSVSSAFDSVSDVILGTWDSVLSATGSAFDDLTGIIRSIDSTIRTIFSDVVDSVLGELFGIDAEEVVARIEQQFELLKGYLVSIISDVVGFYVDGFYAIQDFINTALQSVQSAFETAFSVIVSLFESLISSFGSGSASIGNFLANAANVARRAWESFISWLEEKWNWLKNLLPSLESITNKLPSIGRNAQMAMAGAGGNTSTSYTNDNSNHSNTFNLYTKEATNAAMEKSGFTSFQDTGVRR